MHCSGADRVQQAGDDLTEAEVADCRAWVQEYLRRDAPVGGLQDVASVSSTPAWEVPSDPRKVRLCFSMLRAAYCERDGGSGGSGGGGGGGGGGGTPAKLPDPLLQSKVRSLGGCLQITLGLTTRRASKG